MINRDEEHSIDIESIEIKDVIDLKLLQKFQDNFAESMNIASVTVDKNGKPVTTPSSYTNFCMDFVHASTIGDSRCAACHRKGGEEASRTGRPYIYTCHAGLIDFAAPILIEGKQIGTILGGQVLTKKPNPLKYIKIAKEINVDEEKFVESVREIKIMTEKNILSAAEVLYLFANALSKIGYNELSLKRTSESLEAEVKNKNLLLEESDKYNKIKTQLFSTISHELKTPINIIYSSLQLLEVNVKDGSPIETLNTFTKYSKIMKQNCYRLIRMINNIVDMNKIEVGFFNLNLKNNNIIKVVEDITLSIVEYAKLKNITVIFDTEIEEKVFEFDEEKIERIMLNLLSNSIKYTENNGNIYVNIYDGKDYILISVKDTGTGIPQNMFEKIFNPFIQVDPLLRRTAEGNGIGLSIVKSFVEMHGGEITLKSKLGVGSEFIVKLPVKFLKSEPDEKNNEASDLKLNVEKAEIEFSDIYF